MSKFFGPKYAPKHQEDYFKLPYYERDLMSYYDHLKYQEMTENSDDYFKNKQVVNFDIIYPECRGDQLKKSYKDHKTIEKESVNNYSKEDEKYVLPSVFRNKRDDLLVQRDLIIKHFKENFNYFSF